MPSIAHEWHEKSSHSGLHIVTVSKAIKTALPMPGSGRDEHGCIPSAGYTWCAPLKKCIRRWKTECPDDVLVRRYQETRPHLTVAFQVDDAKALDTVADPTIFPNRSPIKSAFENA